MKEATLNHLQQASRYEFKLNLLLYHLCNESRNSISCISRYNPGI